MADSANSSRYRVTLTEHDSVEWTAGTFSRLGAYRRIRMAASHTVPDWPHPTFAKVYRIEDAVMCSDCYAIQDEWQRERDLDCRCGGQFKQGKLEVCVYTVDINTLKSAGCRARK
jgi:hypothetical protein